MNCTLGIELGSTRIKAVLTNKKYVVEAIGVYDWENKFENGFWTYSEYSIKQGVQAVCNNLLDNFYNSKGSLPNISAIGISAMMHGYIVLDSSGNMLTPFRTWRNTTTKQASTELTSLFDFNIPQRWSVAHLYQAILNKEKHVTDISYLTTLAGYVHFLLTGKKVLGVGDASGMFPISLNSCKYDKGMLDKFNGKLKEKGITYSFEEIAPSVLCAGECAGALSEAGAKLLDPSGRIKAGIPLCPPEGDAGTGMIATNSVTKRCGNVSAGTSVFAMVVLEKAFSNMYQEIDMVTTPDGSLVAMVHCNNCTSDLNEWTGLFSEVIELFTEKPKNGILLQKLYEKSLEADMNGEIINYNYISGEPITDCAQGVPLFVRSKDSKLSLANFMRAQIYSSLATLNIGMEILKKESVLLDEMNGHGGFFKTPIVGQKAMSAAINAPISVMENAGEGGAWGISLLAAYLLNNKDKSLPEFLNEVFSSMKKTTIMATTAEMEDFNSYIKQYKLALKLEKIAGEVF